jgi:hypothetical protein
MGPESKKKLLALLTATLQPIQFGFTSLKRKLPVSVASLTNCANPDCN